MAEILAYKGYVDGQVEIIFNELHHNFIIENISIEILRKAADIVRYQKQNTGKRFKLTDAIIAATALTFTFEYCIIVIDFFDPYGSCAHRAEERSC